MPLSDDISKLIAQLHQGERAAVARALNLVESQNEAGLRERYELVCAIREQELDRGSLAIGITGPPGVGKSTLVDSLVHTYGERGLSVGVLAVDPSSRDGGSLLGDRTRQRRRRAFFRSVPTGGALGGVADALDAMVEVMGAAFDRVIVESVGVGQTELDIADVVDLTALVLQPASGDGVQFLKAGILEIPDLLVVGKADLGPLAERTAADLRAASHAFGLSAEQVLTVSGSTDAGVTELVDALERVWTSRAASHTQLRTSRRARRLVARFTRLHGTRGVAKLGGESALLEEAIADGSPALIEEWSARLDR